MIEPPEEHPLVTRPRWQYRFGVWMARLLGWTFTDPLPDEPKMVVISGPHTSNWDGIVLWMAVLIYRVEVTAMAKDTLFKIPLAGWFFRRMGGLPIDRSKAMGVVDQMVALFSERDHLLLVVPAAGTRKKQDHWKSGFYWVAHKAQVPIGLSYMDYDNKRAGFFGTLRTTGDVTADMDRIREAYRDIRGKNPQDRSTIRLRDEGEPPTG